ncbi:TadE family protein [Oceanobacillus saliphilus]|uniref:TadE family protein n=1 Tax=Oceanobacillus saliphilus TaxID=2925834 RepID=UPI00201DBC52|nr:TadE family protein [Oceanobacillus saliphilus]
MKKGEKGQSLVETALILPILLMIIFGITDFGRIFHAYLTLDHAGREAARVATVGAEDNLIKTKIREATSGLIEEELNITILPVGKENRPSGSDVTITLTYPVEFLTPFVGWVVDEFDLENTTVMRVE